MSKLDTLAEIEGFDDPMEMIETYIMDSVAPAICVNEGCDYCTEMEPDQDRGWCEECETNTVQSCFILGGLM